MIRFSKKRDCNKIWIFFILFVVSLFMTIGVYAQSKSNIESPVGVTDGGVRDEQGRVSKQVVPKAPQDFKMVADVLDAVGGKSESDNFKMQISAGGQPSPIGKSQGTAYKVLAGYVYAAFVLHGDANGDGVIDLGDVVYLINYLFRGGEAPNPIEIGDVNCDGVVELGDVVYLINYLYRGGPPPCDP